MHQLNCWAEITAGNCARLCKVPGRDTGSGDNVPISCWSASCARLSQPPDCQNQAETNCSSESTVSWRGSRSPQLRR